MNATMLPPPPAPRGALRAWVWHPRADVGPKLVTVLRVLKGRGIVVIANDSGDGPAEYGIPVAWLFCPADADSVAP